MTVTVDPNLIRVIIEELPSVAAFLSALFRHRDPSTPAPTNEQVIAALQLACASSVQKDDLWLAAHPEDAQLSLPVPDATGDSTSS